MIETKNVEITETGRFTTACLHFQPEQFTNQELTGIKTNFFF